jgi:hypothetical protein
LKVDGFALKNGLYEYSIKRLSEQARIRAVARIADQYAHLGEDFKRFMGLDAASPQSAQAESTTLA